MILTPIFNKYIYCLVVSQSQTRNYCYVMSTVHDYIVLYHTYFKSTGKQLTRNGKRHFRFSICRKIYLSSELVLLPVS